MSELSSGQTRLAQLWEEHMRHEFQTCSTEDTLATMGEDAYVNHVPVMTGGVGHAELRQFYATHFIPKMPPDMEMTPLSRTIGTDPSRIQDGNPFRARHEVGRGVLRFRPTLCWREMDSDFRFLAPVTRLSTVMGDGTAVSEKGSGFGAEPKVRTHLPPAMSLRTSELRLNAGAGKHCRKVPANCRRVRGDSLSTPAR